MAYKRTTWVDGSTPLDAANMNNIETGIAEAKSDIVTLDTKKLNASELPTAVQDALATAKESGEFDGEQGNDGIYYTPSLDDNGRLSFIPSDADSNPDAEIITFTGSLKGADGFSPTVSTAQTVTGATITITDKSGPKTVTISNGSPGSAGVGIKSVVQTTTSNADGGSNVITVTKTDNTTSTFTVKNGSKGSKGDDGTSVTVSNVSESTVDGGNNVVTFSDGKMLNVRNGKKGNPGLNGTTPVKGQDYFTSEDIAEIVGSLEASLPTDETFLENIADAVPAVKVAEQPEYVNDISECADTSKMYVLPNGHLAAYMKTEVTTEGSTVPNFTNIFNTENGAYIMADQRYSESNGAFKTQTGTSAIVVPISGYAANVANTIRVKGVSTTSASYVGGNYIYGGSTNQTFSQTGLSNRTQTADGTDGYIINFTLNSTTNKFIVFNVASPVDESGLIVTLNEEITYTTTPGGTETVVKWTDTGIEYNQPPDYTDRVNALETKTAQLSVDVDVLKSQIGTPSVSTSGTDIAFAYSAYPPSPQLPGDGSAEADFDTANVLTPQVYAYMDALWNRFRTYMVRQNLGKDSSGTFDYYRYVFSKAYWRAWYKENYPKMYAWKNGSTIIYSESVSPRVGDTMYTTTYIGTAYSTVTAVNSETIGTASTRTVNGLVFTRYADGDVEPTIVYTVPLAITSSYKGRTYTDAFAASNGIAEFTHEYIVDSQGTKFYRYPFEDKKLDKTRLFSVFILANEHGNHGDSMIPCVSVLRMLKDMCENANVPFLRWLKENAIVTVIPVGNPYGGYNNANNVNINRNYDTPGWAGSNTDPAGGTKEEGAFGAYAGDQIETQHIMNTIQQCKAQAAMSCHGRGVVSESASEYNSSAMYQGCGFDPERLWKVEEALFSMYNFGFQPNGQHTVTDQTADSYLNAGKSPSYIEYAGAVGGLIEIDDNEVGTLDSFTPLAMEQAYAEVLLTLQNWCEEALLKAST